MKLQFDVGIKEYEVNDSAVLRMNPSDPALYDRFRTLIKKIEALEAEIAKEKEPTADKALDLMTDYDQRVKGYLNDAFGLENDFEQIFSGLNLMALGNNGKRIVANFLEAIKPEIEKGAKAHAKETAAEAVASARARRATRNG